MDGKNVDSVLMEFGVRFHRLIYEHLQQYSYGCMGGMLAICDVAEYRKCAKEFKVSIGYYCRCNLRCGSCIELADIGMLWSYVYKMSIV